MYRLRTIVGVAVVGAVAVVSAGCSPLGGGADAANSLTIMVFGLGEDSVMRQLATEFEGTHPDITVEINNIPEDVYLTKLETSILANSPPDIALIYTPGYLGSFQPVTETVYAANDLPLSDFNEGILEAACGRDGEIFCVGGSVGAMMLAYNKEMFTAAGIPFPSATESLTMTEYAALAAELVDAGVSEWGGDASPPTYWNDWGIILDDSGRTAELTNPTYVETFETLAGMVADGTAPGPAQTAATGSEDAMLEFMIEGRLGMMILDSSTALESPDLAAMDIGLAPTPISDGTDPWVSSWTTALGIPVGAKNPDAAAEFLALVATRGQELESDRGFLPVRLADAESFAAKGELETSFRDIANLARPTVFTPNLFAWNGIIGDAYLTVLRGESDSLAALTDAEPKVQQVLDSTWVSFDSSLE